MKTFEQATVETSISSIFTKEDVLRLLESQANALRAEFEASTPEPAATPTLTGVTRETLRKVADAILEQFEEVIEAGVKACDFEDMIEQSVELSIGYDNRIEVSADDRGMKEDVEENIRGELPDTEALMSLIAQELSDELDTASLEDTGEIVQQQDPEEGVAMPKPMPPVSPDSVEYMNYLAAQAHMINNVMPGGVL